MLLCAHNHHLTARNIAAHIPAHFCSYKCCALSHGSARQTTAHSCFTPYRAAYKSKTSHPGSRYRRRVQRPHVPPQKYIYIYTYVVANNAATSGSHCKGAFLKRRWPPHHKNPMHACSIARQAQRNVDNILPAARIAADLSYTNDRTSAEGFQYSKKGGSR